MVHRVYSTSWSEGSGGSSFAKLVTYEVNDEKNPASGDLVVRSTTCKGLCIGIGGMSEFEEIEA